VNLSQALELAKSATCTPEQWKEAEAVILAKGLCPACAEDGFRQRLGRYELPTHESYGGRACPSCEMFWPSPGQAGDMQSNEPDYGGAFDGLSTVYSDAGPGL
jgi:hypothetical protein